MTTKRVQGVVIGIVDSLDDPQNLGRVKVKYPHLENEQSDWARIAAPMAGKSRGLFMRPEKDDEVLVAFLYGDRRFPFIIGGLWSEADKPPQDDSKKTENNWRFIKSRSGHIFKFDDTRGGEKIEIIDKDGTHKITIDTVGRKIQVVCDNGDVEVSAKSGSVKVEALTIEIKATQSISIRADGTLTLQGATVNIN